jgi:hypothetical protein
MSTTPTLLMERKGDGVRVALGWVPERNEVVLRVEVGQDGEQGTQNVVVPGSEALDAFYHPFIYAREVTV